MPSRQKGVAGKILQFRNCRLLREHELIRDDLWVRNGQILNPEKLFFEEQAYADEQIDCGNGIIAPGFIDLQINGAFGVDFSSDTEKLEAGIQMVAKELLAHGVTSFCPTIVTSPIDVYHKILPKIKKSAGGKHGAGILGVHIEGPFINKEKKGAHPEKYIRTIENGFQDLLSVYGNIDEAAILTLAPELGKSKEVIQELVQRNITVSVGHSMANLEQGEEAVRNGANFITHLFNAMLPFHHRDPHLVGLLTSQKIQRKIYYGLIADGIHTHPAALRIAHRVNMGGLTLVTDAIPAMGLPAGKHHIGQQVIEIVGKRALLEGTDTLVGSIASMDKCVRHFKKASGCDTVDALECATLHPAEVLNITNRKGTLEYDTDADFIILNESLDVLATYIAGECVFKHESAKIKTLKVLD